MSLSRGGFELNEIWAQQTNLVESRSGVELHQDSATANRRYLEAVGEPDETDEVRQYHRNPEVRRAWPEHSKRIKPTEVRAHDVFRAALNLELGGRRKNQSDAERRATQMMAKRIDEPHVRVRVPIQHLNMQHDPSKKFGHPDSWSPPSEQRIAREKEYAKRRTPFPPIYASSSETANQRRQKRGHRPTLFVDNGNHRVAAAIRRGDTHINAHVTKSDWERFKTFADQWSGGNA